LRGLRDEGTPLPVQGGVPLNATDDTDGLTLRRLQLGPQFQIKEGHQWTWYGNCILQGSDYRCELFNNNESATAWYNMRVTQSGGSWTLNRYGGDNCDGRPCTYQGSESTPGQIEGTYSCNAPCPASNIPFQVSCVGSCS
ncbi:unnamed protein product, partial [Vitrella brassicaformis CCMP3155]